MVATRLARVERFLPALTTPGQLASMMMAIAGIAGMAVFVYIAQFLGTILPFLTVMGLLLILFIVVHPELGFIILIWCAAAVRISINTGTGTPIVASLAVAALLMGGWVIHRMINGERLILVPARVAIPAAMLVGATLFSLLWGRLTLDPRINYYPGFMQVQIAATGLTVVAVGLLFAGADLLRERRNRTIICCVIISIGVIALPFRFMVREVPIVNSVGLFGIWFVAICWSHALINHHLPDLARLGLGVLAIGWLGMAFVKEQSWVSGWLPIVIALVAVTVVARPRLGFFLVLTGIVGAAFYYSVFYAMLITNQQQEGSLGGQFGRLELWQRNLSVVSDHLLFGTGPAGYALYYMSFLPDEAMSTHSNYVDVLAQNGIFGLLGLIFLFVGLFTLGREVLRRTWHATDRATTAAIVGGIPAVAASLWLGDWLIPFVYNQTLAGFNHAVYSWLMFAMLCGLYTQTRRERVTHA